MGTPPELDNRSLNRALLARQLLLERAPMPVEAAIEHLVGLQAQAPDPPYFALWSRLTDFRFDELGALLEGRRVVRLALMRSTIHVVTAADAPALRAALQPALDAGFRSSMHNKKLAGLDLAPIAAAGRRAVNDAPLTFGELGASLATRWPERDRDALAQAVRTAVPLVQVPPRGVWGAGGQARHRSLEVWLNADATAPMSLATLVCRYLAAFGPASVADIQAWSGLTRLGDIVEGLSSSGLSSAIVQFRSESGARLFDLPDAPRPGPDVPAPVRFVAPFDNVLLSHADRSRIISEPDRRRLFTANGIILGAVLLDGMVCAQWKFARQGPRATVRIEPFRPIPKRAALRILAEGRRLVRAAAPHATDADVLLVS